MPLRRRPVARIATTAVVAGTAANMGARSAQRSAEAAQAQAAQDQAAQDQAAPPPAPADEPVPEAAPNTDIEQLKQFAALRDQGILTEEEFAAKKAQILGI